MVGENDGLKCATAKVGDVNMNERRLIDVWLRGLRWVSASCGSDSDLENSAGRGRCG